MTEARFCSECGAAVETGARFCGACGALIDQPRQPGTSGDKTAPAARPAMQPSAKRNGVGFPMIMIASGSVLAIAAVLFSGVLSPDKSPPRSSSERTAVQQDQSGAQVPSTQSVVRLGPVKEPNATASDLAWKLYVNSRYGVTVEYPSQLFTAGDPPADNSGRGFDAADGSRFFVYSSANALEQSVNELMTEVLEGVSGEAVIDKQQTADGFTVILQREQETIHRHLMTSEGGSMLHWLEIGYPEELKPQYAAIAERMLASFQMIADASSDESGAIQPETPTANVIDIPLTGWTYNAASKDFANQPALVPEAEYAADNQMGFLAFTCQPGNVSPAYFMLLFAPGFDTKPDNNDVRLGIEGAGANGELRLAMRDYHATSGGERPEIDWDATVLFARIGMENLGQFAEAQALLVKAAGQTWRLASGGNLARAGKRFLTACESDDAGTAQDERGPDEFSFHSINSSDLGFAVEGMSGSSNFSVDVPDGWVRVPNTMDHELVFASPDDDFDAQMFLAILAKPSQGQPLSTALDAQLSIIKDMTDTETLERGQLTMKAGPAERARIRFLGPSGDQTMLVVDTAVLQRGDITYVIEVTVPEPVWHTGQQVIEQALKSLNFQE
jgi:hypothetical protein